MKLWVAVWAASALAQPLPVPLGLDTYIPTPERNRLTPEKVSLGRALFHDKRLSRDGTISCASCHDSQQAFGDGRPVAIGIGGQKGTRNSPNVVNRAYGRSLFWDGRAATLEQQVLEPIANPVEMGSTLEQSWARIREPYAEQFRKAFGRDPEPADLADALAAYVRTILSGDSRYDRYIAGNKEALTADEQHGLKLFRGKANCASCHVGPNLTDERFHNTGTAWHNSAFTDEGRAAVTKSSADRGAFKTPTLRDIASSAPYMHDGGIATLEEVIDYYDKGGRAHPGLDTEIRPLNLTSGEKAALIAFLEALTGRIQEGWPSLATGSSLRPPGAVPQ